MYAYFNQNSSASKAPLFYLQATVVYDKLQAATRVLRPYCDTDSVSQLAAACSTSDYRIITILPLTTRLSLKCTHAHFSWTSSVHEAQTWINQSRLQTRSCLSKLFTCNRCQFFSCSGSIHATSYKVAYCDLAMVKACLYQVELSIPRGEVFVLWQQQ